MKAILAAVNNRNEDFNILLEELKGLCKACNIEYTHIMIQNTIPSKAYYLGKGKAYELKEWINDEEMVIFNDELSGLQMRNLRALLDIEVTDRTDLILRIFASRAHTKEARLQVEIARLNYELPRLSGMHQGIYSQQGGMGFRGAGETQLELDRRKIHNRIAGCKKELAILKKERQIQRKQRKYKDIIALTGYTNSGKSSLMNLYTHKKVEAKDMLFATLQTSSRKVRIKNRDLIMSDTVGFISHLPTHLIQAFLSTLEEVKEASLILMIIDRSSPYVNKHIEVTLDTLNKLGVKDIPILYVYNKEDLESQDFFVPKEPYVFISVKNKTHMNELEDMIITLLTKDYQRVTLDIPYTNGGLYNELSHKYQIIKQEFKDRSISIVLELDQEDYFKYRQYRI
ncbi:GTPase HflX [Eggerthia catenaformis]|uniref:GTPase HflX n=1 Tax=Eggerthia catenaformis TaxID=31973 RepID=UPI00047968B0|nr:GTPase HflX [Eggerthia catenaformis]OUC51981.1 GTPase HflX [Eggerthia catenaformis]